VFLIIKYTTLITHIIIFINLPAILADLFGLPSPPLELLLNGQSLRSVSHHHHHEYRHPPEGFEISVEWGPSWPNDRTLLSRNPSAAASVSLSVSISVSISTRLISHECPFSPATFPLFPVAIIETLLVCLLPVTGYIELGLGGLFSPFGSPWRSIF